MGFNWVDAPFQLASWGIAAVLALFALYTVCSTFMSARKAGGVAAIVTFGVLVFIGFLMANVDQGSGLLQDGAAELGQMEQYGGGAPRVAPAGE